MCLPRVCELAAPPRVVMMTADDTPESLLEAVAAGVTVHPQAVSARHDRRTSSTSAAAPAAALPIEVVSARPDGSSSSRRARSRWPTGSSGS